MHRMRLESHSAPFRATGQPVFVVEHTVRSRFGGEPQNRLANLAGAGGRRHGFTERDRHRIRNPARPFPEESAALETEDAAPEAAQIDGDDRNIQSLGDLFHPRA